MPTDSPAAPENPTDAKIKARALAAQRREAMRLRARRIRQSVAALTASLFIFSGAYIGVQLANGKDPSLLASSSSGTSTTLVASSSSPVKTTASGGAAASTTASTASTGTATTAASTEEGSTEGATTSVTTSQS